MENTINQEESTGYLLYNLTTILQRKMKRELDKLSITHMQFVLLATIQKLSNTNKTISQIEIANESKTDKMMVSKVLRTLQTKEFITRNEHQTDTRSKTIELTKNGEIIFEKAFVIVKQVERNFFQYIESHKIEFNENLKTLISQNQ
jgi:DNA-binding MarR family transcriptional regulator